MTKSLKPVLGTSKTGVVAEGAAEEVTQALPVGRGVWANTAQMTRESITKESFMVGAKTRHCPGTPRIGRNKDGDFGLPTRHDHARATGLVQEKGKITELFEKRSESRTRRKMIRLLSNDARDSVSPWFWGCLPCLGHFSVCKMGQHFGFVRPTPHLPQNNSAIPTKFARYSTPRTQFQRPWEAIMGHSRERYWGYWVYAPKYSPSLASIPSS